ncbi:MAG: bifunctional folylpolyglutamate synthase/dihydrofolate synthase [Lachnospiraceae bacterium]|nr:bifunctional folylpolyglutamate synthase/dihydrofolate synthase [Lachnospiraceae bacterium]
MEKQQITTFETAVDYLYNMPRFTTKNTLEDTKAFLKRLGNPDCKMNIIHVAGTNGKGSVCAYLRSILEAAGKRVAVFTSPHLVDVRERFLIKGKMVEKQVFLDAFLQVYDSLDWDILENEEGQNGISKKAYHPTFFEYLFFMAMIIFSRQELDYCILETGLGGRLDATNAVKRKVLSVITRISLDHVEYLGNTIKQIAEEKAGIMQEGVPVIFTDSGEEATGVFRKKAAELGILAYSVSNSDYAFLNFKNKSIDFSVHTGYYGYVTLTLHTIARYQMENAALAVRAIELLDREHTITTKDITEGISSCFWAGRMEEILPEVFVDGAHNEDGIRAFLDTVREDGYDRESGFRRSLLFSVVQDKDYERMVQELVESDLFDKLAIAQMHTNRAISMEILQELLAKYPKCNYHLYTKVDTALEELLQERGGKERIYIAGSLYLVGEIKESFRHD